MASMKFSGNRAPSDCTVFGDAGAQSTCCSACGARCRGCADTALGLHVPSPPLLQRCEPDVLPADAGTQTVLIVGEGFPRPPAGSTLTCHVRGGMFFAESHAANNTAATYINSTAISCDVPAGLSSFDGRLDVKLDGNESWSNPQAHNASSLPALFFRTFVEAGFGRRPYLSNETSDAELILRPDVSAMKSFPATRDVALLHVCYSIGATQPNCHALPLPAGGAAAALPVVVAESPEARDINVSIDITLMAAGGERRLALARKYRRLMVAPADRIASVGSFTAVDHRRRSFRVDGDIFIGKIVMLSRFAWTACR